MRRIIGTIIEIRELENCIRATNRYTEFLFTEKHPKDTQGAGLPCMAFTRPLEVYLDAEFKDFNWNADFYELVKNRWDWLRSKAVIVRFWYDYRDNKARMDVHSQNTLNRLAAIIPGFERLADYVRKDTPDIVTETNLVKVR